jgi:uncharacterized protein YqgC (DUF456 family)
MFGMPGRTSQVFGFVIGFILAHFMKARPKWSWKGILILAILAAAQMYLTVRNQCQTVLQNAIGYGIGIITGSVQSA